MTPDLDPFRVYPSSPSAELMGVATAYVRFEDEAEARSVMAANWTGDS